MEAAKKFFFLEVTPLRGGGGMKAGPLRKKALMVGSLFLRLPLSGLSRNTAPGDSYFFFICLRKAAKKIFFSGPTTKALTPPPPLELSGHRNFSLKIAATGF